MAELQRASGKGESWRETQDDWGEQGHWKGRSQVALWGLTQLSGIALGGRFPRQGEERSGTLGVCQLPRFFHFRFHVQLHCDMV